MREIQKHFIVTVQPSFGLQTTTEVMIFSKPTSSMLDEAEEIIRTAQKNVASRVVDYDDYEGDSAYQNDLEECADGIKLAAIRRKDDQPERAEHFLYRAKPSDQDDRVFRHVVHAADEDEASFLARWQIAVANGLDPKDGTEAFLDAMSEVEIESLNSLGATAPRLVSRHYRLWTSDSADQKIVEITVPDSNEMFDDVIWAYVEARKASPFSSATQYAGFGKIGPEKRFLAEGRYTDGNDTPTYSDWFQAVDAEDAEFQVQIETAVNQGCDVNDLGSLIETAREIPVVDCHEEPTTKDEMLQAIRNFVTATDAGTDTSQTYARLKDIVASADALTQPAQPMAVQVPNRFAPDARVLS